MDTYPAWSPDGQWIAFVSENYSAKTAEIWISKVDGGDRRQITENRGEVIAVELRWSR